MSDTEFEYILLLIIPASYIIGFIWAEWDYRKDKDDN